MTLSFVCIGPRRTGTSWLDQALRYHPDLCLPSQVKETFYFDVHFGRGHGWYEWHFRHSRPGQLCGEVAPTYFEHDEARQRLHAYAPAAQILCLLRSPLERASSLYRHALMKGPASGTFSDAVRQVPNILESGCYKRHVTRWIDLFGRPNVHVLLYDDLVQDPSTILERCWRIVHVAPVSLPPEGLAPVGANRQIPRYPWIARATTAAATTLRARRLHRLIEVGKRMGLKRVYRGKTSSPLTTDERERILDFHREDIEYAESLLGRDLSHWREQTG